MSAAVVACGGDDDDAAPAATKGGGLGESCERSADCGSNLICIDQMCAKKGTTPGGAGENGSGGSGATGGTGGTGATGGTNPTGGSSGKGGTGTGGTSNVPAPVLSAENESCTRTADCEAGLGCFNQRCLPNAPIQGSGGEGGQTGEPPPVGPVLGQYGETCVLTSDCATGLACLPGGINPGLVGGNIGVCTYADTGVTATGNSCSGECREDADCCELPTAVINSVDNVTAFASCSDIDDIIGTTDCVADPSPFPRECFIKTTYCKCKASTWKCTDHQCAYNAECSTDGMDTEGCPTHTRSGNTLVTTCNDSECRAETDPICSTDADCETLAVAEYPSDTCSPGECTCFKATRQCFRRCDRDLDCDAGQNCDTKTHVCMDADECTSDLNCQKKYADVRYACDAGKCQQGCKNDLDCNTAVTSAFTRVCNADNVCEDIGCTQDSECSTEDGLRLFCEANAPTASTKGPHSAHTTTGG